MANFDKDKSISAFAGEAQNAIKTWRKNGFFKKLEPHEVKLVQKLSRVAEALFDQVANDLARTRTSYLETLGADDFTAQFISKEQTWRRRYQELIQNGISISDPPFLEQMRVRLGWEYFVDLSYRAHFSHTLEVNGAAVADVPAEELRGSAERLARQLRNEFSGSREIPDDTLIVFLLGFLQRMRRQGAVAHTKTISTR